MNTITEELHESNLKALKKAINGKVTIDKKEFKGHVLCDIYQLHDTKKHGFDHAELVHEKKLVEAAHAHHVNTHYKTTNKLYIISGEEAKKED